MYPINVSSLEPAGDSPVLYWRTHNPYNGVVDLKAGEWSWHLLA